MAGPRPRTDREARAELHLVSIYAYARAKQLARRHADPTPTLRPREREALQWVAAGKTDWEIGEILGISESAAHKHVENAKRKIGVATRVQAVVEAIRSGQLQL
jgi:DNA-binding CsgD family transcriptional regulator